MDEKRSHDATDWREGRRLWAWELSQAGWSQVAIAAALGVTPGAVSQWLKRARQDGVAALYKRKAPGAKPQFSTEQLARLPELLAVLAENTHPSQNPSLRVDNRFGLSGLTGRIVHGWHF